EIRSCWSRRAIGHYYFRASLGVDFVLAMQEPPSQVSVWSGAGGVASTPVPVFALLPVTSVLWPWQSEPRLLRLDQSLSLSPNGPASPLLLHQAKRTHGAGRIPATVFHRRAA